VAVASPELWQDGLAPALDKLTLLHVLAGSKRLPLWENWLASLGIRHVDPRPGIAFSTMDQAINAAVSGAGVAVVDAPMVERELAEQRLRRLDHHELTASHGYWFVEPRDPARRDPAHSAVVALFQAWLIELSRSPVG
jgi:LysR family transcriptional regulator, glycine cleavage system transcriptional activator